MWLQLVFRESVLVSKDSVVVYVPVMGAGYTRFVNSQTHSVLRRSASKLLGLVMIGSEVALPPSSNLILGGSSGDLDCISPSVQAVSP